MAKEYQEIAESFWIRSISIDGSLHHINRIKVLSDEIIRLLAIKASRKEVARKVCELQSEHQRGRDTLVQNLVPISAGTPLDEQVKELTCSQPKE